MKDKLGTAMLIGVSVLVIMFVIVGIIYMTSPTEKNCIADCNAIGFEYASFKNTDRFSSAFCKCLDNSTVNESTIVDVPAR